MNSQLSLLSFISKIYMQVLGRRRPDGSSLIKVEELRDGIVTFEDEADAQRFAEQVEAEGVQEVGFPTQGLQSSNFNLGFWVLRDKVDALLEVALPAVAGRSWQIPLMTTVIAQANKAQAGTHELFWQTLAEVGRSALDGNALRR